MAEEKKGSGMEKAPTFWEADGALRAYANRAIIAVVALSLAVIVLTFDVIFTHAKAPMVIRVGPDGAATVLSADGSNRHDEAVARQEIAAMAPDSMEVQHFVIDFVTAYMQYDQNSVDDNWARAVSMMTSNLKAQVLKKMTDDNSVGKVEDSHERSVVTISSLQPDQKDPMLWHVYAQRNVTRVSNQDRKEDASTLAEAYTIRLVEGPRSVSDPSGLMIAEFHAQQISAAAVAPPQQ